MACEVRKKKKYNPDDLIRYKHCFDPLDEPSVELQSFIKLVRSGLDDSWRRPESSMEKSWILTEKGRNNSSDMEKVSAEIKSSISRLGNSEPSNDKIIEGIVAITKTNAHIDELINIICNHVQMLDSKMIKLYTYLCNYMVKKQRNMYFKGQLVDVVSKNYDEKLVCSDDCKDNSRVSSLLLFICDLYNCDIIDETFIFKCISDIIKRIDSKHINYMTYLNNIMMPVMHKIANNIDTHVHIQQLSTLITSGGFKFRDKFKLISIVDKYDECKKGK